MWFLRHISHRRPDISLPGGVFHTVTRRVTAEC